MSNSGNIPRVILSFDFEIGWGDITNERWRARQWLGVYKRLRPVLRQLLDDMDDLELPATFACVGSMFDDPDQRMLDHLPNTASRIVRKAIREGHQKTFDGRDLFDMVLNTRASHDIACHTYTHIPFDFEGVNARFVREDLSQFKRVLADYGSRSTDRFVFPENTEGFHEELSRFGFKKVRTCAINPYKSRIAHLASQFTNPPPLSLEHQTASGLTMQSGSMLFNSGQGKDYRVPIVYHRAKRGVDLVAKHGGTLHLWAHPFNFAESEKLRLSFGELMRHMTALRNLGKIEICPM